jgi:hypothetical protein
MNFRFKTQLLLLKHYCCFQDLKHTKKLRERERERERSNPIKLLIIYGSPLLQQLPILTISFYSPKISFSHKIEES